MERSLLHFPMFYLLLLLPLALVAEEIPIYKGCGATLTDNSTGIIDYPGDGTDYPNQAKCTWNIFLNEGEAMEVSFQRFTTTKGDTLLIKNGIKGTTIGKFQGSKSPVPFVTEGNKLFLFFKANAKHTAKGFKLTWKKFIKDIKYCVAEQPCVAEIVRDGNDKVTSELENKIQHLEVKLQALEDYQKTATRSVEAKLDYIIEQLGICCGSSTTPSTSSTTEVTATPACPLDEGFFMSEGSSQCFKLFKDTNRNWADSKVKCCVEGLQMARPTDAVAIALRKDIIDIYGDYSHAWLAARGDGSHIIWEKDDVAISNTSPLWHPGHPLGVTTDNCLLLLAYKDPYWLEHPSKPYATNLCSATARFALCELV